MPNCRLCGFQLARFKGYVIVPTAWGIEHEHKPGDCPPAAQPGK